MYISVDSMASSSDVEHEFAIASRRAKVRSARANRTLPSMPLRGDELDREFEGDFLSKIEQSTASVVLVEQNDESPKPITRVMNKEKRGIPNRGVHAGKNNKGARDRRKLREKRRSTGVMHLPSTESTGGSTGEDENNENSLQTPPARAFTLPSEIEEKIRIVSGKRESDLDADDEENNSGDVRDKDDDLISHLKQENDRLGDLLETKDKRIEALEIQVAQLTRQLAELREENSKLKN